MAPKKTPWLFGSTFLEDYAGRNILHDPIRALMELLVNSWDAGATKVDIDWPASDGGVISIKDNGIGMSEESLVKIWKTWKYDRIKEQGSLAVWPENASQELRKKRRHVFGKNGKGRFATFCFGESALIKSWNKDGGASFKVRISDTQEEPFVVEKEKDINRKDSGTEIIINDARIYDKSQEEIMSQIGMRMLTDPDFKVFVNGREVTFESIPVENIEENKLDVPDVGEIIIKVIDIEKTDSTTRHHGVAWHVNGRLVGDATWKGIEYFIDGRKKRSRRYTFIVIADCLADTGAILFDWSRFDDDNETYSKAKSAVSRFVVDYINQSSSESRKEKIDELKTRNEVKISALSLLSKEKWVTILDDIQRECPTIRDPDIDKISDLMINLEKSKSKYSLLYFLSQQPPKNLDDLNEILQKWGVVAAKEVLDEIERRILLINDLERKVDSSETDELHELQPIFEKGLWMLGAEFESIEFQSNKQMRTVLRDFLKTDNEGSTNRPDFIILPDGSMDGYSRPAYDNEGELCGVEKMVVLELKKPKIPIGVDQKNQADKYAKELKKKVATLATRKIHCYVLGSDVDLAEQEPRKEGIIEIQAMRYSTLLERARKRLLNLEKSIKEAPFYKEDVSQMNLFR